MDLACSKYTRGKGLGNNVTGTVVASIPRGSASADTIDVGGRTVKPLAMDQSLMVEASCSDSVIVRSGGYCGTVVPDAIVDSDKSRFSREVRTKTLGFRKSASR